MSFAALALIAAAGWSPTQPFDAGAAQFHEPVPRVAIDAQGGALLAYETGDRRLVVSVRRKDGGLSRPKTLAKRTLDYAVAPGAVAYEAKDGIHVATRTATGFKQRKVASSTGSEINGVSDRRRPARRPGRGRAPVPGAAAAPSRTACAPSPRRRRGPGRSSPGPGPRPVRDSTPAPPRRSPCSPTAAPCSCSSVSAPRTATRNRSCTPIRPHGGPFTAPAVVGDKLTDARVTVAGDRAVLTATMTALCGDTSCAGQPRAIPLNPDGSLGAPVGPTVARASRAFAPWAAPGAIVFQLKSAPKPFSREAPIRAAALTTPGAPLQTLTRQLATEPVALPLDGNRTLALWATRTRFGAALAGPDGTFRSIKAPKGAPPAVYHTNSTNRDVRAAGAYAIVAWARGHTVRERAPLLTHQHSSRGSSSGAVRADCGTSDPRPRRRLADPHRRRWRCCCARCGARGSRRLARARCWRCSPRRSARSGWRGPAAGRASRSHADVVLLAFFPFVFVAALLFARRAWCASRRALWLDAAIGSLGAAAIVAQLLGETATARHRRRLGKRRRARVPDVRRAARRDGARRRDAARLAREPGLAAARRRRCSRTSPPTSATSSAGLRR